MPELANRNKFVDTFLFAVVDVPTEEYLDALIASEAINQHKQLTAVEDNLAYLVVHFTPWDIVQHPRYRNNWCYFI